MESLMISPPAITGLGLVTVLGSSADETWSALLAGRSVSDHCRVSGFAGPTRAIDMAIRAAGEAISHARWSDRDCGRADTALIVATSKGTIESWISPLPPSPGTHFSPSPSTPGEGRGEGRVSLGLCNIDSTLAQTFHFGLGPRLTISSACSSGLHALARAALALQSGEACRALVVATEASVHPLFISSFKRLGILSPEGHGCRPFDVDRKGFIITEAAAAICLESPDYPLGRPLARLSGWALGSDATHLTGCDPAATSLRNLLHRIAPPYLDLIHAHATGTLINDPAELGAILSIPQTGEPILYSHKAALGHTLGAAGLVSAVVNCLCHREGLAPGNIRSTKPLPAGGLRVSREAIAKPIHHSLALAAGFAGPLAAVCFAAP